MGLKSSLNQIKLWFHSKMVKPKLDKMFQKTKEGYVVYKIFGKWCEPPKYWKIREGSIIEERVDMNRDNDCSYGINVATLKWLNECLPYEHGVWICLIKFEDLDKVCVPRYTDGKIRCGRLKLLKKIEIGDIFGYPGECYD